MFNVWRRNYNLFKKSFIFTFFWTTFEPLVYLLAIGFGLSQYIASIEGISFIEFYFSGLICSHAMLVSYFETTYPVFNRLNVNKTFNAMLLTSLTPNKIFWGEVLWASTKGLLGSVSVILGASLFGLFSLEIFKVLPIIFLMCLISASFGMIVSCLARSVDSFIFYTSGFVIPMTLLSGTYFSLNEISAFLKSAAFLFPLPHAIELCRILVYKKIQVSDLLHFIILIAWLAFFQFLGRYKFNLRFKN